MNAREFANTIREKAKTHKINPIELESAVGEVLTTTIKERIKNHEPQRQQAEIAILLATIMCCFGITVETLKDESFLAALEEAEEMLEGMTQ